MLGPHRIVEPLVLVNHRSEASERIRKLLILSAAASRMLVDETKLSKAIVRRRMKFRFGFRLGQRQRKQSPEEQFVIGGEAKWAEHSGMRSLLVTASIGEVVSCGMNQVLIQRCFWIERTQGMLDQGQLTVTGAASARWLSMVFFCCYHIPQGCRREEAKAQLL